MNFSISSLFITLCISLVLITIFSLILTHEKSYHLFRADLLFVLVGITCLRLFFPFELPFTKTIALPSIMNPLTNFLGFEIFNGLNVLHILIVIWLVGVLIGMGRYVQNIISAKKIEDRIIQNSKCYKASEILNHFIYPDYDVYHQSDCRRVLYAADGHYYPGHPVQDAQEDVRSHAGSADSLF